MDSDKQLHGAATAVGEADALLVTAGAGMGVDSGLPDFRGTEGFWRAYPAIARRGISFAEMANPAWFQEDPGLAWAFYGHRLNLYRRTVPHAGFQGLLETALRKPAGYFVFTSNVDGQFQKAGFSTDHIVECHGSIHHFQCTHPCGNKLWEAGGETVAVDESAFRALPPLPKCRHCPGLARPNILMFNDWHWISTRAHEQENRFQDWVAGLRRSKARLAVIELGAGTAIPTVRLLSERVLRQVPGSLIRINPAECHTPPGHFGLAMGAAEGIRRVLEGA